MSTLELLALAVVQGLTEFLPVSSSAHLVFLQSIFGLGEMLAVDVILHVATLAAVFVVFRRDLQNILHSTLRGFGKFCREPAKTLREDEGFRLAWLICVGSFPTAVIGLAFKDVFESLFAEPRWAALFLLITGVLLWISGRKRPGTGRDLLQVTERDALLIGLVQGLAICPGISRSGSTIVAGLLLGLTPAFAAHFSFLLSIPAILGALLLTAGKLDHVGLSISQLVLAFISAMTVGIFALKLVVRMVEKGSFRKFAYYAWPVGLLALIYFSIRP